MTPCISRTVAPALLSVALLPTLAGCVIFQDSVPILEIQAFARQQTKEDAARAIDEMMAAEGFKRVRGSPTVVVQDKIMIDFGLPSATIEGRPSGARICVQLMGYTGDEEFRPNEKAPIARLRTALADKFGATYIATAPCSAEPYWPGGVGS